MIGMSLSLWWVYFLYRTAQDSVMEESAYAALWVFFSWLPAGVLSLLGIYVGLSFLIKGTCRFLWTVVLAVISTIILVLPLLSTFTQMTHMVHVWLLVLIIIGLHWLGVLLLTSRSTDCSGK